MRTRFRLNNRTWKVAGPPTNGKVKIINGKEEHTISVEDIPKSRPSKPPKK